ncbi:MAG: hypothetical protein FJ293_08230 [Planctomycetes bacterium]|nr:hypothetical protein [Planctomycetota bacterium]
METNREGFMRRRRVRTVRLAAAFVAFAALVLAVPGCALFRELGVGGDEPQWVERRYRDISIAAALQLVQTAVQERYPPRRLDAHAGVFESGWVYGAYEPVRRQALRQRIFAEAARDDAGVLVLKLRVQQETSPSAGRGAAHEVDDWELSADAPDEAERLLTRVHVLLRDIATPVEATKAADA